MHNFYILAFVFGICLILWQINQNSKIKKFRALIEPSSEEYEMQFSNASNILEKSDKILFYLKLIDQNVALKVLLALGLFFGVYFFTSVFGIKISKNALAFVGIFSFIFFIIAPAQILRYVIEARIRKIGADIPMFVDLLAICVQSGMSIEASIKFLEGSVSEINKAFAPFLKKLIAKMNVSGLEPALDELNAELPSKEISMMCSTLKQSLKYGSQIYETLMGLSAEIRESGLLATEEAIGKLSAKMSVPLILFFMFPVIIVIAAPGVMRVLGGFL